MAEAVEATEQDRETARHGILLQLRSRCPNIDEAEVADFIDNQVEVIANQRAYIRFLNNIVHHATVVDAQ